jgi:cell division transport system permease protein
MASLPSDSALLTDRLNGLVLAMGAALALMAVLVFMFVNGAARVTQSWSDRLEAGTTIRLSGPHATTIPQAEAIVDALSPLPGVARVQIMTDADQARLLEPWLGPDIAVDALNLPQMVTVFETSNGYDPNVLAARISAIAPDAVIDDHRRWYRPLIRAATRFQVIGWLVLILVLGVFASLMMLALKSALAANRQVIAVLRLIGGEDRFIQRLFMRRFVILAILGALIGTILAVGLLFYLAYGGVENVFGLRLRPEGADWGVVALILMFSAFSTAVLSFRTVKLALQAYP